MTDYKTLTPQPKCVKKAPFTVEVPGAQKKDGETIPRRNHRTKDGLVSTPAPGVNTIWDIVTSSARSSAMQRPPASVSWCRCTRRPR